MSHRSLVPLVWAAGLALVSTGATADPLDPPVRQDAPPASDPVDPARCVGRGTGHPQNGLMVAEEDRFPLRVFASDGSGSQRALTHPHHRQDSGPAWSPDGRHVAFVRGAGTVLEIWTVDVASGRERRLVDDGVGPAWSPDGRWISFSPGLRAIRPDGTGEHAIGSAENSLEHASWSPNGRCLAGEGSSESGQGLAIIDSRGGAPNMIFPYKPRFVGARGAPPSWSHDGRRLLIVAQTSFSGHVTRLVRVNVDGTGVRLLTPFRDIIHAVYSPDGRTIAFSRRKVKGGAFTKSGGVYTMPAGGGRARLVIPHRYAYAWGPRVASSSGGLHPSSRPR